MLYEAVRKLGWIKGVRWAMLGLVCLAVGCTATSVAQQASPTPGAQCLVTEAEWLTPPADAAVGGESAPGYYYVNEDRSIWAAAWWTDQDISYLRAGDAGIKTGWFRPAGVDLEITGRRIDGAAGPLVASVPCCYPTRFQASGLAFPAEGCWEIEAVAADSRLSFTVWVEPAP